MRLVGWGHEALAGAVKRDAVRGCSGQQFRLVQVDVEAGQDVGPADVIAGSR